MTQTINKQTRTEQTVYGEVEYEVYECVACSQEYRPEKMEFLYDGEVEKVSDHSSWQSVNFSSRSFTKVPFCPSYYGEPSRIELPYRDKWHIIVVGELVALLLGVFIGMLLMVI